MRVDIKKKILEIIFLNWIQIACSVLFSYFVTIDNQSSLMGLLYVIMTFWYIYMHLKVVALGYRFDFTYIFLMVLIAQLPVLLGFSLSNVGESVLWAADSYRMHLPNAISFSEFLSGEEALFLINPNNPFHKMYISNMYVGLFFYFFGVSHFITASAVVPVVFGTSLLVYKATYNFFLNSRIASIATLIFTMNPIRVFYSSQFYKEFMVQFFVSLILYLFSRKDKWQILLIIPLFGLFVERFYLFMFFLIPIFFLLNSKVQSKFGKVICSGSILMCGALYLHYFYPGRNLLSIFQVINEVRLHHNLSSDITPASNFFIDFFRIHFTPFPNSFKFDNYVNFNSLLLYGSSFHHLLMFFYFLGLFTCRKRTVIHLSVSFLFFCILFAYIEPFNGRVRDSFLPLISVISSFGVYVFMKKIKRFKLL